MQALFLLAVIVALAATEHLSWWQQLLVGVPLLVVIYGGAVLWALRPAKTEKDGAGSPTPD